MSLTQRIKTATSRAVSLAFAIVLAGCGGGSEESPDCGGDFAVAVTAGLSCFGTVTTPSPPPPATPPPSSPPPPPAPEEPPERTNRVHMQHYDEFEPNDIHDNANPVAFGTAPVTDHIGISVTGTATQDADPADFFVFTPTRTGPYLVYLRRSGETEIAATDEVYIAAYDQSQSTIDATPIGTVAEQVVQVDLTAGLAYYVEINAYNTGVDGFDYELVIID